MFLFSFTAPPNIMPFLFPNKVLTEGMRSAVSCQILEGNLPIKFHWEKNGRELYDSSYNGDKRKNLMPYHSHGGGGGKSSNSIQMFDSSNWKYDSFQQHHKNNNKRDSAISIRSNDEYSSTLIIDRLEFNHRGNYTCTASNAAGMSFHTAELKVNGTYTISGFHFRQIFLHYGHFLLFISFNLSFCILLSSS
jgi:hypothetical protein